MFVTRLTPSELVAAADAKAACPLAVPLSRATLPDPLAGNIRFDTGSTGRVKNHSSIPGRAAVASAFFSGIFPATGRSWRELNEMAEDRAAICFFGRAQAPYGAENG